ncbi:MAG: response regulator [Clostridiales Family XIII bacterium]|jgi:putative two-component system response regulator|nr:response regulator [Clostridiales Family XIII bacterium]
MSDERQKIILVDDDPIILKMARNTLMHDYDVFTAPDAAKLFQFLEKTRPDLILLDVMLPETSGYETMARLRADLRTAEIPVVFLTAKSDADSEFEAFSLGAADYVVKPFSPPLLSKRVEVHMLVEAQKKALKHRNEDLLRIVAEKTEAVLELQGAVLKAISNLVECRDDVTGSHVERTESFLRLLVDEMLDAGLYADTLRSWDLDLFFSSAQLHDVGKIAIRDSILLKPGRLSSEEFDEMKKHTTFGETIIDRIQSNTAKSVFLTHARIMAGSHHEKWDGTGYPRGVSGGDIPLQGRLMAVVDVYDALSSERPYKKALSHDESIGIIDVESGRHFDPDIAGAFKSAMARRQRMS